MPPTSDLAPLAPPPADALLAWMLAHPEQVAANLQRVFALSHLEVVVTYNGKTQRCPIRFSASNATIEITLT